MIKGVYQNQKPTTYDIPKPFKKVFTEDDLFKADVQTFGSLIGPLTNRGTSIVALISEYEQKVKETNDPEDIKKLKLLHDRLKMVCAGQSRQIDKAKIGKEVKGYPKCWTTYQKIKEDDSEHDKEIKTFYNSLLCDRKPYFFQHLYKTEKKRYSYYKKVVDARCHATFRLTLKQLLEKENKTPEEELFIENFHKNNKFINSDCELNKICRHIENTNFKIKEKVRDTKDFDYNFFIDDTIPFNNKTYKKLFNLLNDAMCFTSGKCHIENSGDNHIDSNEYKDQHTDFITVVKDKLYEEVTSNKYELVNYLIKFFYEDKKTFTKNTLWKLCGDTLYDIAINKCGHNITFVKRDKDGPIKFWNDYFSPVSLYLKQEGDEENDKDI